MFKLYDAKMQDSMKGKMHYRTIMERPVCQDASTILHFIDDRSETLLYIAKQPELQRWKLYFADWCPLPTCAGSIPAVACTICESSCENEFVGLCLFSLLPVNQLIC
jgi:hypothetical protein